LKEQETTFALNLIPNFEIGRCREKWTEQREELHNKKRKIHESGVFTTEGEGTRDQRGGEWVNIENGSKVVSALSFIFTVSVLNSLASVTVTCYWFSWMNVCTGTSITVT